jgi:hypothetical protein
VPRCPLACPATFLNPRTVSSIAGGPHAKRGSTKEGCPQVNENKGKGEPPNKLLKIKGKNKKNVKNEGTSQ